MQIVSPCCRVSISTCLSRYRPTLRSATSCAESKGVRRIGSRWSFPNCANDIGAVTSGPEDTSAPPAATSRTMSYFSIFVRMNLPAPAGSYSVPTGQVRIEIPGVLTTATSRPLSRWVRRAEHHPSDGGWPGRLWGICENEKVWTSRNFRISSGKSSTCHGWDEPCS